LLILLVLDLAGDFGQKRVFRKLFLTQKMSFSSSQLARLKLMKFPVSPLSGAVSLAGS